MPVLASPGPDEPTPADAGDRPARSWRRALRDASPLRSGTGDLPDNVVVAAKIVALGWPLLFVLLNAVLGAGAWGWSLGLPAPFLPFLPWLDALSGSPAAALVDTGLAVLGGVLLLTHRAIRGGALLVGISVLVGAIWNKPQHGNNQLYAGLFLVIVAIAPADRLRGLLRLQLGVVYLGAALNKLLLADWWNGAFLRALVRTAHDWSAFGLAGQLERLFAWRPGIAVALGVATICTESLLAALLLSGRRLDLACWIGALFHLSITLISGDVFVVFLFAVLATYLALQRWPPRGTVVIYDPGSRLVRGVRRVVTAIDVDRRFRWREANGTPDVSIAVLDSPARHGLDAVRVVLLCHAPVFLVAFLIAWILYFVVSGALGVTAPFSVLAASCAVLIFWLGPITGPVVAAPDGSVTRSDRT